MREALINWFRERIPISGDQLRELTNEPVPNHLKRWWFCLGGTPAYLFLVQIVTGILLAFYYQSAPSTAYESVRYITEEARYGWYLRGLHKWGATLMVASVILHQLRIYFTGAYRAPRELNWLIGMALLGCTLTTGFTGYCLVYEQLSYWGAVVGANIADSVPIAGPFVKQAMLGGDAYNARTLSRFFIVHTAVLPATTIVLLVLHISLIRLQGVTQFRFSDDNPDEPDHFDFFPDHFLTEIAMGLVLMILLTALATAVPAEMGPRANPLLTPEIIKPEWFFYVMFRWLKLFSGTLAVLSSGFVVFVMCAWPFIDAFVRRHTRFQEASVYIGILASLTLIGLTVWEAAVAH